MWLRTLFVARTGPHHPRQVHKRPPSCWLHRGRAPPLGRCQYRRVHGRCATAPGEEVCRLPRGVQWPTCAVPCCPCSTRLSPTDLCSTAQVPALRYRHSYRPRRQYRCRVLSLQPTYFLPRLRLRVCLRVEGPAMPAPPAHPVLMSQGARDSQRRPRPMSWPPRLRLLRLPQHV